MDYLFAAQYPNGGWPQFFPRREDYSRHVTFNDGAMIGVMLAEIEHERRTSYSWLGPYAAELLRTRYPEWRSRVAAGASSPAPRR